MPLPPWSLLESTLQSAQLTLFEADKNSPQTNVVHRNTSWAMKTQAERSTAQICTERKDTRLPEAQAARTPAVPAGAS